MSPHGSCDRCLPRLSVSAHEASRLAGTRLPGSTSVADMVVSLPFNRPVWRAVTSRRLSSATRRSNGAPGTAAPSGVRTLPRMAGPSTAAAVSGTDAGSTGVAEPVSPPRSEQPASSPSASAAAPALTAPALVTAQG